MRKISNDINIEELAKRVDCIAKNVSRILGYLAKDQERKEDERRRGREKFWS